MEPLKAQYGPEDVIANQYRVERVLGKGGMGVVYLVTDVVTNQRYALKTMLPRFTEDHKITRRFVREVETVRRLRHPAIVRIYDARRVGSMLFYTMDYVEGRRLVDWIRKRRRLDFGSTVRILALLADTLEYAHQFTIHRDISPENVMVLRDGSVRLLDFGLAKFVDNEGAFTMVGDLLGKIKYKAPEQHTNAAGVDSRADIYPLGVMCYVMLAGRFPKKDRPLSQERPDLPADLDAFVDKATAHLPKDRFQTAREFRLELMRIYGAYQRAQQPEALELPAVQRLSFGQRLQAFWYSLLGRLRRK
ncbi:MAG: protein kinase [Nitrospiraceae bacterium]|nr:protein kinase [Nitrospiraceae bacterium]